MVLRRREKKEQRREERESRPPQEERPAPPAPTPTGTLAGLRGTIRTLRPGSTTPYGIPWGNVTRFEPAFTNAGKEFEVDPFLMAAMAVVESDANHEWPNQPGRIISRDDGLGDGPSVGIMQVKPKFWKNFVPGADIMDPVGNIRIGTAIMARAIARRLRWETALTAEYFPQDDPNGTTQNEYVVTVRSLLAEMRNQLKPVIGPPQDLSPQDPISVIVAGAYPPITYGWLADAGLNYYAYGVGHGTTRATQHTGVDVGVRDETPLFSPFAGKVLCVGSSGSNIWGQGCGAYPDTMGGGIGNITILGDSGHKLTLGHCSSATVRPGDRVAAGQRVGRSGGMNGYHVHIEVAVERNGTYFLVDPIPALKEAMGGTPVPTQPVYAERLPVPQPGEFDKAWTIEVTADRVPVKQTAHPDAPDVTAPLTKGEQFKAPMQVIGRDGKDWWISLRGGRVPVAGTKRA